MATYPKILLEMTAPEAEDALAAMVDAQKHLTDGIGRYDALPTVIERLDSMLSLEAERSVMEEDRDAEGPDAQGEPQA